MLSQEANVAYEVQSVDRFKRCLVFDAIMLREFERGLCTALMFFSSKERTFEFIRHKWDTKIGQYKAESLEIIKN